MYAHVFMLENDQKLFKDIKRYLEDTIFRDIRVEAVLISNDHKRLFRDNSPDYIVTYEEQISFDSNLSNFTRFINLLKASMVKVDAFSIGLFNNKGQWGYVGYEDDKLFLRLSDAS